MLFEVVTIDLHYMTDRRERFDLKISKLKLLRNYPFNLDFIKTISLGAS